MSYRTLPATALFGLGLVLVRAELAAQDTTRIAGVGTRVRLGFADKWMDPVIGNVVWLSPDSITVATGRGQPVTLHRSTVHTVQLSIEQKTHHVRGAAIGAGIGAVAGGMAVLFTSLAVQSCDDVTEGPVFELHSCFDADAADIVKAIGLSALSGATLGALLSKPKDHWVDARLEASARSLSLGVRVAF